MGALVSILGGAGFRAIWGGVSSYFDKRQDHKHEVELLKLQADLDDKKAANALAAQKLQAELGYKTINVQADADVSRVEAAAFQAAMERAALPTGIKWVDAWNGCIRPAFGTVVLALWVLALYRGGWLLDAWSMDVAGAIIGYFFVDRSIGKRK